MDFFSGEGGGRGTGRSGNGKRGGGEVFVNLLTLSAHAREGYSSHFVCQSLLGS